MRSRQTGFLLAALLVTLLGLGTQPGRAQQVLPRANQLQVPELQDIIVRLEEAQLTNRARYRAYTITREYRFYGEKDIKPDAEVVADISFVPPDQKTFKIEKAQGSEHGAKIVRRLLERDSETTAARKTSAALARENYSFALVGSDTVDGQPCWLLEVRAKREDRDLINGHVWVDRNTYLVHRAEGEMAKSPSWWLKKVYIRMDFRDLSGMWMQTSTHAVADVRFFGRHIFTDQAVRIQTSSEVGQVDPGLTASHPVTAHASRSLGNPSTSSVRRSSAKRRPIKPAPLLGAGILE